MLKNFNYFEKILDFYKFATILLQNLKMVKLLHLFLFQINTRFFIHNMVLLSSAFLYAYGHLKELC